MSGFGGIWTTVLGEAIEAGRGALRELDAKEVPAALSRVASYQGGRLPPPLAARLLAEIDRNDWLRGKVLDAWSGQAGEASDLFLNRPDGWWLEVAEAAATAGSGKSQGQLEALTTRIRLAESKRDTALKKAAELKKAANDHNRRSKRMVEDAKSAAKERYAAELVAMDAVRSELGDANRLIDELKADRVQLQASFEAVRSRLLKARRDRSDESDREGGSSFLPNDPVKLARLLDLQSAAMSRDSSPATTEGEARRSELMLAPGVRPDSSDAIRWLLDLDEAVVVLVDGYNAQFHLDKSDFTSGGARRRLVEALKRLRTAAPAKHRVVVVYDSTLPGERIARTSLGGVEVRFADKDQIADEEIVEMTAELSRAVVISSDRAVRDGAEASGAVVLWSEALQQWLARR